MIVLMLGMCVILIKRDGEIWVGKLYFPLLVQFDNCGQFRYSIFPKYRTEVT